MVDQEAYKQVAWKIVLMLNFEVVFRLQFLKKCARSVGFVSSYHVHL